MKVSDYIRCYYDGVSRGDDSTCQKMAETLYTECKAEITLDKVPTNIGIKKMKEKLTRRAQKAVRKCNEKGNLIADRMNQIAERQVVKRDWFLRCVTISEPKDEPEESTNDNPENWE